MQLLHRTTRSIDAYAFKHFHLYMMHSPKGLMLQELMVQVSTVKSNKSLWFAVMFAKVRDMSSPHVSWQRQQNVLLTSIA